MTELAPAPIVATPPFPPIFAPASPLAEKPVAEATKSDRQARRDAADKAAMVPVTSEMIAAAKTVHGLHNLTDGQITAAFRKMYVAHHLPPRPTNEWPKWITPHESHIMRHLAPAVGEAKPVELSPPIVADYPYHVARDGAVTVLVSDQEEADEMTAAHVAHDPNAPPKDEVSAVDEWRKGRAERRAAAVSKAGASK